MWVMANGKTSSRTLAGEGIGEKVARLDQAVQSIAADVAQLTRNMDRLSALVADRAEKAGRTDWRALAAWASVIVTFCTFLVGTVTALGIRELDALRTSHADHLTSTAPTMVAFAKLQQDVPANHAKVEAQMYSLSARVNMLLDEQDRMIAIVAEKAGVNIPPRRYFPPEFGSDTLNGGHK